MLQSYDEGCGPAAHKVLQLVKACNPLYSALRTKAFCASTRQRHCRLKPCFPVGIMTNLVTLTRIMQRLVSGHLRAHEHMRGKACAPDPQMLVNPGITYVSSKSDSLLLEKLRAGLGPDPAIDAFDVRLEKSSLFNVGNVRPFGSDVAQHKGHAKLRVTVQATTCGSQLSHGLNPTLFVNNWSHLNHRTVSASKSVFITRTLRQSSLTKRDR